MGAVRVTGLDHLVVCCADVERVLAWYVDVLGLEPVRLDEWRRGEVPFASVRVDAGTIIDLLPAPPPAPGAPRNVDHVCLVVEETDLTALAASGVLDAEGPPARLFGARGEAWAMYVRDPEGNRVELRHYPPAAGAAREGSS